MNAIQSTNPFEAIDLQLKTIQSELLSIKNAIASSTHQEKTYYTIAEAAQKLNVSTITVYRNAQAGKIPTKRIGSRVMIPGSYLDK
ncbi:MAG TPA: helix-turn-helix domain-containing protein [Cyclobacteriaceae bacterium]|nr:helix-turn-helix domain-containing protein [Cyclobacteriaceae bacterium]